MIQRQIPVNTPSNQVREQSFTSQSPNKKQDNDISIQSNRVVDLNMVVKSSQTKYTRDDFMKLKKRMDTISPTKNPVQSQLDIIKESQPLITTNDGIKHVSFKDYESNNTSMATNQF